MRKNDGKALQKIPPRQIQTQKHLVMIVFMTEDMMLMMIFLSRATEFMAEGLKSILVRMALDIMIHGVKIQ